MQSPTLGRVVDAKLPFQCSLRTNEYVSRPARNVAARFDGNFVSDAENTFKYFDLYTTPLMMDMRWVMHNIGYRITSRWTYNKFFNRMSNFYGHFTYILCCSQNDLTEHGAPEQIELNFVKRCVAIHYARDTLRPNFRAPSLDELVHSTRFRQLMLLLFTPRIRRLM